MVEVPRIELGSETETTFGCYMLVHIFDLAKHTDLWRSECKASPIVRYP